MKWIKRRDHFLNEAKIRELILPSQSKEIKSKWGEKYLDYEEVEPTKKIDQGVWKLSEEDKRKALGAFFSINMDDVYKIFNSLPKRLIDLVKESIDVNLLAKKTSERYSRSLNNFDLSSPSMDEIYLLYENVFRKLSVSETKKDEVLQRDDNGRPIMDENNKPIKIKKKKGEPVWSKNLVNFNTLVSDYNICYKEDKISDDILNEFKSGIIQNVRNFAAEDLSGDNYDIDFDLFKGDLYLSILHNPKDILNMSISKFYSSCQNLYSGSHREQLLSNVFDPNSIPAYLKFDKPIYYKGEKISDQVPLSRVIIRNIETFDDSSDPIIYFDRVYPNRGDIPFVMKKLIEKYSKNKESEYKDRNYQFIPDIDMLDELGNPYMDKYGINKRLMIGKNAKKVDLSQNIDWSETIISPDAKIEELIISSVNLPHNFFDIKLNLNWIKFKFLDIKTIKDFRLETDSYAFEKCKLSQSVLDEISNDVRKLQFVSCDISDLDLTKFKDLDELQLVYTIDDEDLNDIIKDLNIKKLVISSDVMLNIDNKNYISFLKRKGIKVEIIGPKI